MSLFRPEERDDYLFRARVAQNLAQHWVTRANNLKLCGDAGVKLRCDCGEGCVVPYRCGARSCPSCARLIAAQKTAKVANRVRIATESRGIDQTWDGKGKRRQKAWKLFTATSRAGMFGERFDHHVLLERIKLVRGAWGPFWRSTAWGARVRVPLADEYGVFTRHTKRARRDTAAVMGIEVAPGGMVHLHAAIYGEWLDSRDLQALWGAALGESAFVKIKAMKAATAGDFDKALREVLKYVTKWDKAPGQREQRAAAIEAAMRGVRRVEMVGFIRAMPGADALIERPDPEACGGCGKSDAWSWACLWLPEKVAANGGFGRVALPVDDADRWAGGRKAIKERDVLRDESEIREAFISASDDAADRAADSARRDDRENSQ